MTRTAVKYQKGVPYSITINPHDNYQFLKEQSGKDRLMKFINYMNEVLMPLTKMRIEYYFCIELSEPFKIRHRSSGSRLHLHGIIRFNSSYSVFQFLSHFSSKLAEVGDTDIDTIGDLDEWDLYIHKQNHIFKSKDPRLSNILEYSEWLKELKNMRSQGCPEGALDKKDKGF